MHHQLGTNANGQNQPFDYEAYNRKKTEELIKTLSDLKESVIKQKNSTEFRTYIDTMAKFHRYSFSNQLLIAFQRPTATKVAGYRTWPRLNRNVRKGAQAIRILAPCFSQESSHRDNRAPGNAEDNDQLIRNEPEKRLTFRTVNVFDIADTDGDPLPKWDIQTPDQNTKTLLRALMSSIRDEKISIDFVQDYSAYGSSEGGRIKLRKFMNDAMTFTTLLHEFAHEMLHKQGAGIDKEGKEIEAETVAYCVSKHFNVSTPSDKYLAAWVDKDDIFFHIEEVRKAANQIIIGIEDRLFDTTLAAPQTQIQHLSYTNPEPKVGAQAASAHRNMQSTAYQRH